ncbi:MAG: ATP-binding cassette domain-containing protein, partial [Akkermansiaceae bacterium]|nr:ATP-binding cassette domain-containing protein [Akkermansiaceae bacterium]
MSPILELKAVSKSFSGNTILRDINLSVGEGDFVSIIGYSGSGKSTLINLIAGLLKPNEGTAKWMAASSPAPAQSAASSFKLLTPPLAHRHRKRPPRCGPDLSQSLGERAGRRAASYIDMVKLTPASKKIPREL